MYIKDLIIIIIIIQKAMVIQALCLKDRLGVYIMHKSRCVGGYTGFIFMHQFGKLTIKSTYKNILIS